MDLTIRKLAIDDAEDIYNMLQEIPADENGFINSANGKTYDEYRLWLEKSYATSLQEGIIDGWKVPEVLTSGNFAEIAKWQEEQAYERTKALRPDLLE